MKILLQESETSRIVQKFSVVPALFAQIICRQHKNKIGLWIITSWLYTHQYKNLDGYISHFNSGVVDRIKIGSRKQF